MNDNELDVLLAGAAEPLPETTARLARSAVDEVTARRQSKRRRWALPAVVAGAVVLTGGAGVGAVQLAQWQGITMPEGHVRTSVPIPLEWIDGNGHSEHCAAWIELSDPRPGDRDRLDRAIEQHDWSGFGQELYESGGGARAEDSEAAVGEAYPAAARDFVGAVIPEAGWLSDAEPGSVAVAAVGFRCDPEAP